MPCESGPSKSFSVNRSNRNWYDRNKKEGFSPNLHYCVRHGVVIEFKTQICAANFIVLDKLECFTDAIYAIWVLKSILWRVETSEGSVRMTFGGVTSSAAKRRPAETDMCTGRSSPPNQT